MSSRLAPRDELPLAQRTRCRKRRAVTLIELLVVIAILGVLISLLLPAVQAAREAGRRVSCLNNLHQQAIAAHLYHDVGGRFPPGSRLPVMVGDRPTGGTNLWVELLPFFEQGNLYNTWDYNDNRSNVAGGTNATQAQVIKILICPSDSLPEHVVLLTAAAAPPWAWGFYGMSSYGGNAGRRSFHPGGPPDFPRLTRDGIFYLHSCVHLGQIIDGSSNTFLFGERYHHDPEHDRLNPIFFPRNGPVAGWGKWSFVALGQSQVTMSTPVPINYQVPPDGDYSAVEDRNCAFGSGHPRGANFAFADGSVRFLSETTSLPTLQALSTRAGREPLTCQSQ
jgi:prepilin-type N-terminal cleavage/methylation domain-containing protein/prepilin-type processing-associated H-X9-DG protein